MLERLKRRSDTFREWADAVQNALDPDTPKTCDLDGLRTHLKKAQELKIQKTDLVRALEVAIEDAEKCASVIHQLDLNKMRTRTRNRDTSTDHKYRLTVEELTLFCEEIDGLACVLPEGSAVKEVLRQTREFERRSSELLSKDVGDKIEGPDVHRELDAVVELGSGLCIQLPQLPRIIARAHQIKFLDEVRMLREDYDTLTPDTIDKLVESGIKIQPHCKIEEQLAYLQSLKKKIDEWEKHARAVLISPESSTANAVNGPSEIDALPAVPHISMDELSTLLAEGDAIEAALPSRNQLATAINHAKDWLLKVEEMQSKESYPYFQTLEVLVKKGASIPLSLYEKDLLANSLEAAKRWKERTSKTFLKKNWQHSLMEALSPRTDILFRGRSNATLGRGSGKKETQASNAEPPPSSSDAELFLRHFSEDRSPTEIVTAFKVAEDREIDNMTELRMRNMRKDIRLPPQPGITFCLCSKRQFGVMNQCELCKDWFHASCMKLHTTTVSPPSSPSAVDQDTEEGEMSPRSQEALGDGTEEAKFLCPLCHRTRRPHLETILSLLVSLQGVPVRLAEGEALQCLTERAMAWQDRARANIRTFPKQMKDKTDKSTDDRKRTSDPHGRLTGGHGKHDSSDQFYGRLMQSTEHAYSALPQGRGGSSSGANASVASGVGNTAKVLSQLTDLAMEGDLLEVTLRESAQIAALIAKAAGVPAPLAGVWSDRAKRRATAALDTAAKRKRGTYHPYQRHNADKVNKLAPGRKRRGGGAARRAISPTASAAGPSGMQARKLNASTATTTNYLNRKQGLPGNSLLMKKHYMARQDRRRRGLTAGTVNTGRGGVTHKSTRGRRAMHKGKKVSSMTGSMMSLQSLSGIGRSSIASDSPNASSTEDDEDCAASMCLRPTGKVDWVQCDGGCDKWFHMLCVGLIKNTLKEDEDYYCNACRKAPADTPEKAKEKGGRLKSGSQRMQNGTDKPRLGDLEFDFKSRRDS